MKTVIKTIVNVFAWILLVLALLVTILVFSSGRSGGVANLFGYIPLTVESDSMYPTFKQGDLIICKQVDDIYTLKEDDVITFWTIIEGKKVKNTHRIVSINEAETTRSFVTRGDNNPIDDDMPAYAGDLIGKWTDVKIGGAGKAMAFLRTKVGFFVCILIPMAVFFLIELYKFIITLIELKRPVPAEALDEEEIKRRAIEEYLAAQKNSTDKKDETKSGDKDEKKSEDKDEKKPENKDEKKSEENTDSKPETKTEKTEEQKDDTSAKPEG